MFHATSAHSVSELAARGDYYQAVEALGDRWLGVGIEPSRQGESDVEYARLLLTCGILTQEIGEMRTLRSQAAAKDLLTKAIRLFDSDPGAYEARFWLGLAYLRCGENHEALAIAEDLLEEKTADSEAVFCAGRLKALAHLSLGRLELAEAALKAVEVFLPSVPPMAQGRLYLNRGMVRRRTGQFDSALLDYEMARRCFRRARSDRFEAAALNNIAGVYSEQGRFREAHAAARHALLLFQQIRDRSHEAKVWDQIAQIHAAEEHYQAMEECASRAVDILSNSDHEGWLAEALITQGTARARLGMVAAKDALSRAFEICQRQDDPQQAEMATKAMWAIVQEGGETRDALRETLVPFERAVYECVLDRHEGHIRPAAHELGLTHQALQRRLRRFPELLSKRLPPRQRRKTRCARN